MFTAAAVCARLFNPAVSSASRSGARGLAAAAGVADDGGNDDTVIVSDLNGVRTLRMNRPKKLNAWTASMMLRLRKEFEAAAADPSIKVTILTGTGRYYCAGVDLAATLKPMYPKTLFQLIEANNVALFDSYIDFPKPLLVCANGPMVGASMTSATLCDAIMAQPECTFSTPFAKLGVPPEGCSSVHFERIMGAEATNRILGPEGWQPDAAAALEIGLIDHISPKETLQADAQALAEKWIAEGKPRMVKQWPWEELHGELKAVNAKESHDLATAFLSADFIERQRQFQESKGKTQLARTFFWLGATRPFWSLFL
mmetsp:Transcript_4116/g.10382  ORF Transcript_4116/g.10382 Transcript_4116/m.10382 type:complete len:314 (-) Transcript_4116:75-1016(-)